MPAEGKGASTRNDHGITRRRRIRVTFQDGSRLPVQGRIHPSPSKCQDIVIVTDRYLAANNYHKLISHRGHFYDRSGLRTTDRTCYCRDACTGLRN